MDTYNDVDRFLEYLKTNREAIRNYNEKLIDSGSYLFDNDMMGDLGAYPESAVIPPQASVVELENLIENSIHQMKHDEAQEKRSGGEEPKEDLLDKFYAWHRGKIFETLKSLAEDNGFNVTVEELKSELNPMIDRILKASPKANSLAILNALLDQYKTTSK